MGGLRKQMCCLAVGLTLWAAPSALVADARPDPLALFATCTGRLSALMEFQWLVQDQGADLTKARRDAMADLLEAATPEGLRIRAMQIRLEAKVAAAAVFLRGWRGGDPNAGARARALLSPCAGLMVS
jgi:hypothetical protein